MYVEGGEEQLALLHHLIEAVDTSGGLLRHTLDLGDNFVPQTGLLRAAAFRGWTDSYN